MRGTVLLQILKTLINEESVTAAELATLCGISERTAYRYIDELTVSGIPINTIRGRYGGFSLDEDYKRDNCFTAGKTTQLENK